MMRKPKYKRRVSPIYPVSACKEVLESYLNQNNIQLSEKQIEIASHIISLPIIEDAKLLDDNLINIIKRFIPDNIESIIERDVMYNAHRDANMLRGSLAQCRYFDPNSFVERLREQEFPDYVINSFLKE